MCRRLALFRPYLAIHHQHAVLSRRCSSPGGTQENTEIGDFLNRREALDRRKLRGNLIEIALSPPLYALVARVTPSPAFG